MILTPERVIGDISVLPSSHKTADIDRLIRGYVRERADASLLREYVFTGLELHRIYFFVSLMQISAPADRLRFIDENLLFSAWQHTDQIIRFASDAELPLALSYAEKYVMSNDAFVRRWGYVMFISKLCRYRAKELFPLLHNDGEYYVKMAEAWLLAELAVFEADTVYDYLRTCELKYDITGRAIGKICDSFRVPSEVKERFRGLRAHLR